MNKKVSFEKKIKFPTMIGEVCSISLEKDLKFISNDSIEGNLLLSGQYKMTEASVNMEDFSYEIPVEISLSERLDSSNSDVDISDFYYEIENDDTMICYIDLEIHGEELNDERECDGDDLEDKEIEIPVLEEEKEEEIVNNTEESEIVEIHEEDEKREEKSIFNVDENDESFGTFIVYLVRENETVNSIIEKYNTTLEKIEQYNDLKDFSIGSKLIIPLEKDNEGNN